MKDKGRGEEDNNSFFVCSVCGEIVDQRAPAAVRLHHTHMRYPWMFSFQKKRVESPNAERKKADAPRR